MSSPEISVLDARLAEIDGRLRTIQTGLAADSPAPRPLPVVPPAVLPSRVEVLASVAQPSSDRQQAAELVTELRALAANQERLLASVRSLLAPASAGDSAAIGVSVGPLASTEALREFASVLASLDGVVNVEVRGYEGGDRALLDVHLAPNA